MRWDDIGASDCAHATIGSKDNNGCESGFESSIQEGETLDIKHVDFIDEEDTGDEFGNALVDVLIHDLIDLLSQFICDFGLLRFHDLSH